MTTLTTANLPAFLQLREEFRDVAYDDKNPSKVLEPGDVVEGTLTYGYGAITRPDGSPLQIGDTITHQEALDRLNQYIREEVDPAIANLIHVPITGAQADALGSLVYNFGAPAVAGWRLIRRINAGEPAENIAIEWLTDTFTSKGEPMLGLYRRRIMEVLMFFGLDWRAGAAVSWSNSIMEVLESMGWDGTMPKPGPAHNPDAEIFEEVPAPSEDEVTADLNRQQLAKLGGAPVMPVGNKPLSINTKQAEEVPYGIDPAAGLQPKEEAERVNRYVKKKQGEEMERAGQALTVATGVAATANEFAGEANSFIDRLGTVGLVLLGLAFGAGILWWAIGFIRKKWNAHKEVEAEINAVQGIY